MIRQCFSRFSSISLQHPHNPLRAFVLGVLALLVLAFAGPAWSQIQLGLDIDGEAASDQSGYSVSLSSDGTRVAIGAYLNDGNGNDSGHVRVYDYMALLGLKLGTDIDGEAASDQSGVSVSLSSDGTRVAIGAYCNDGANGSSAGHVRVYDWTVALLGLSSAQTSTARRPMINRALGLPVQRWHPGGDWGALTTATVITQATCGSMTGMALLGLKLGYRHRRRGGR